MKRKSSQSKALFTDPLRVETADSRLLSSLSVGSGPASAPSSVGWPASHSPLAFLSPSTSLSPGYHYYPHPALTNPSPSLNIYQSSTPVRAWQHPFSISSLLGTSLDQDSGYDSHHVTDTQLEDNNEDSYIDVVGLDEEEESNTAKETVVTEEKEEVESKEKGKTDTDRLVSPSPSVETKEESQTQGVYDVKKKMLDSWRSQSREDTKELSEYQHKKIRKASHEKHNQIEPEPLKAISEEESDEKLKKKSFQLERYEVNTNINKNKRKEEKWSSSELDSPDKYKDQHKVKKKHKSHKEERWKISKNLKSPIRNIPDIAPSPPSGGCTLTEADLVEGLRLLLRVGSHFYAGRLTEISAPDIYGIIIDKERGNKPHIFSRQEIIRDAVSHWRVILFSSSSES